MEILLTGTNGSYSFDPRDPQSRIADGGMGVVYSGQNVETGQKVAIKVVYRELARDEANVERARREAAINIEHPNLIRMHDFIEKDGIYHIVSEFLEGQNLDEFIKQNPKVSTAYAIRIIIDVLSGLEALHQSTPPIIHRDIKPSNIFLCYDGTVKLMDFGIARITGGTRKSLTGLGTVVGSPHYSPPEQVRGEIDKINQTTDIYALGITFYELLTGNPPFDATNEFDILKKQVDEPLPENPSIPVNIFDIIKKTTYKKQENRYASVGEVKKVLVAVLIKTAIPDKKVNKKSNNKAIKVFFAVFFIIIGIYMIAIMILNGNEKPSQSISLEKVSDTEYGLEMVFVKGGTFTMGCTSEQSDCYDDEKPTHQVTLSDFLLGKYEVTQKQWRVVMGASTLLSNPSYFNNCDNCPVENVSWNDVQDFIKKLNQKTGKKYRLPTEAEWEYAARGGASTSSPTLYAGSNNIDEVAWHTENSNSKSHPVGQKKPNEINIYDMSGNVNEWCSDWYGSYSSANQHNPKGASTGEYRVLGGGSWGSNCRYCRVSFRNWDFPVDKSSYDGFRLAHDN
jgi:formylglycine-generating enzyme required for sulfatase activity